MKRLLTILGLVGVLAVPASVTAADGSGGATATEAVTARAQLSIRFVLRSENGKPVELKRFRFRGLAADCAEGQTVRIKGKVSRIGVNKRKRFRHVIKRKKKKVRIEGRVRQGGAKVTGKIRAQGNFGGAKKCDSGKVRWTATLA